MSKKLLSIRKILHQIHLWAGLFLSVPLVLLGLSGSILVFQHELSDFSSPSPKAQAGTPHNVQTIIDAASEAAPDKFQSAMYMPAVDGEYASVYFANPSKKQMGPGGRMRILVDPVSLATVKAENNAAIRFIRSFHTEFLMREYGGRGMVGWFGVMMVTFGITGIVLWLPRRNNWKKAFVVQSKSHGWRFFRELHGSTGIWTVAILLVVSISGVYLAFPETMADFTQSSFGVRDLRGGPDIENVPDDGEPMAIGDAIVLAQKSAPQAKLISVKFPGKDGQPYQIAFGQSSKDGATQTIYVDPYAKQVMEVREEKDYSMAESVTSSIHGIHAGHSFGWVWKMLVFAMGLTPALFGYTGVAMWLSKRKHCARAAAGRARH